MTDRLLGSCICLVAVIYGWVGYGYTTGLSDPVGPAFMPILIAVPMFLFSLYLVVRPDPDPIWATGGVLLRQTVSIGLLITYSFALLPIGFLLSTAFLLMASGVIAGAAPRKAALLGVIGSPVMFVLFDRMLALPLPKGILSF